MSPASNAEKRQARIAALTSELRAKHEDRSARSRARCKAIALELVELFRIEEGVEPPASRAHAQGQFDLPLITLPSEQSRQKPGSS